MVIARSMPSSACLTAACPPVNRPEVRAAGFPGSRSPLAMASRIARADLDAPSDHNSARGGSGSWVSGCCGHICGACPASGRGADARTQITGGLRGRVWVLICVKPALRSRFSISAAALRDVLAVAP
jgi:hypothetical protein